MLLFLIEQELPIDEMSIFSLLNKHPTNQPDKRKHPETEHTKIKDPELGTHLSESPNLMGAQEEKKGPVTWVTTLWLI